jgi:hypothetical protein
MEDCVPPRGSFSTCKKKKKKKFSIVFDKKKGKWMGYIDDNVVVVVAADVPSRSCAGGCCSPSCSLFLG